MKTQLLTEPKIVYGNRLIAEFMGFKAIPYNGDQHKVIYNGNDQAKTVGEQRKLWGGLNLQFTGRFVECVKYPFNTDFRYLLPVINRIEKMNYVVCIAGIKYQVYRVLEENKPIVSLACGDVSKKTEMVYFLIIDFIKWYNQNLKGGTNV